MMRHLHVNLLIAFSFVLFFSLFSCKSKKLAIQQSPTQVENQTVRAEEAPKKVAVAEVDTDGDGIPDSKDKCPDKPGKAGSDGCPEVAAIVPAFRYQNILFEFNSSILKTSSYLILDEISREMKKYPETEFTLNGHSSSEGTADHNMSLSVSRAEAVKTYLVNSGVNINNLSIKGFGATVPLQSNNTEAGRQLNRRVEIRKN